MEGLAPTSQSGCGLQVPAGQRQVFNSGAYGGQLGVDPGRVRVGTGISGQQLFGNGNEIILIFQQYRWLNIKSASAYSDTVGVGRRF